MNSVTLRGLLSRKLRTILTMIAIVLGVSMISGTYVLTDTINQAFTKIFQTAGSSTDAVITGKQQVRSAFGRTPTLPAELLSIVRGTPGVAAAAGSINADVQLFNSRNKSVGAVGGAPSLLFSRVPKRFAKLTLVRGREPQGDEIAIDTDTFNRSRLHLGQIIGVAAIEPVQRFRLVGVVKFGSVGSLGGAALVTMDLAHARKITNREGQFDQISVAATPGLSQQEVVSRINARIPAALRGRVTVKTSQQNAQDATAAIGKGLSFLTIALLAFGGIAIFVGAFVIFNTFSITVAQRAREFALLRTIGATRSQILRSVIIEALLIGFIASVVGLLAGIGIAKGLNALFIGFGIDLPNTGSVVLARTIIVALAVGTLVTCLASLMPAIRATRVPPIAALREGTQLPRGRFSRFTPMIAGGLIAIGIIVLAFGTFAAISSTGQRLSLIGFGAAVLFLGAAMLSPQLVTPLASIIGWPIDRMTNLTGRLARENAVRNPSRTAVTAAALMIGLALVGFVTIFAAELKQTATDAVNREIVGTYAVYNDGNGLIPPGVGHVVAGIPGVAAVSSVKVDGAKIAGIGIVQINGIQPSSIGKLYNFQWVQGSNTVLHHLGPRQALIDENMAKDHHLTKGSVLRTTTPTGAQLTLTVAGIYKVSQFLVNVCVPYNTIRTYWKQPQDFAVLVNAAPHQNVKALQNRISRVLSSRFPTAAVHSQQDLKDQQTKNVNQVLALIYVLLAMSVIVSLFGIINTLVLSVYERTREIGMLRAIGTTRTQIRWIIRWESVITSVIGSILGLVLGVILAVLITAGLSSQGIEYALPIGSLLIWVVFAIFFGIVAAAFPARRAARLDVLQAVSYE